MLSVALPTTIADELARTPVSPASRGATKCPCRRGAHERRSGPRPRPHDRADRQQGDDGNDLGAQHDAVDVDGRPPAHLVAADQEHPDRTSTQAEATAGALPLAGWAFAASAAGTASDGCHRDRGHAVFL